MGLPGRLSDHELLEQDFGAFYDRHLAAVAAFVGGRVRAPDVAFDLVAETFGRALEKRAQYDPARAPAVAWLLGIARNLIVDAARRGQVKSSSRARLGMAPVELDDEQLRVIEEASRVDLGQALSALPAEQREAVLRRVVLEMPYATIATELRCSEQVVRQRVIAALVICGSDRPPTPSANCSSPASTPSTTSMGHPSTSASYSTPATPATPSARFPAHNQCPEISTSSTTTPRTSAPSASVTPGSSSKAATHLRNDYAYFKRSTSARSTSITPRAPRRNPRSDRWAGLRLSQ